MLYLTPMHAEAGLIKSMIGNVQAAIRHVRQAAQQLPGLDRWAALLGYICRRIVGLTNLPAPPLALPASGQLPLLGSISVRGERGATCALELDEGPSWMPK